MQRLFDAYEPDWDSSECVTYLYASYEYAYAAERLDFIAVAWTYAACGRLDYSRYGNRCSVVTESFIALRLTDSIGLSHVRKLEETL